MKKFGKLQVESLLEIPGTRRAADGVIVPFGDDAIFHITDFFTPPEELRSEEYFFLGFCSVKEILRLRNLRSSHDYLLRLRANAIADSPRAQRVFSLRRRNYEQNGREWSLAHYYHSMDRFHKSYCQLLSGRNRKLLKQLPTGMALIQEANAVCLRSLVGDVVVVSESLWHFYYFMTIAFYGGNFSIRIQDQVVALLIAVRIMNGSEALDFDLDPRCVLPPAVDREIRRLVDAQMMFTFGHEYAHFLRGHLSSPDEISASAPPRTYEASDISIFEQEQEFEADYYSVKNIENDSQARARVAVGGFSVLTYLSLLESCAKKIGATQYTVLSTHPSSIDRVWSLFRLLGKNTPLSQGDVAGFISVAEQLKSGLDHMISVGREDLLEFYGSIYLPGFISKIKRDRIDF